MDLRILVVCYSRGGRTLRVAQHVAEKLGADLEVIEEPTSREGVLGYVRSALEAVAKGLPTIRTRKQPKDYDVVVLGTPVWVGTMSSPIRSYVHLHRDELDKVAFFAVMGGQGAVETVDELGVACGVNPVATCTFTQHEVDAGRFVYRCDGFIRKLEALRAAPLYHASA